MSEPAVREPVAEAPERASAAASPPHRRPRRTGRIARGKMRRVYEDKALRPVADYEDKAR
jgi:hypothetical protein